jgi:two-component system OmpR family sensor kinase
VKLVASVLCLVTLALIVVGVGSVLALRSYLIDQVDSQLGAAMSEVIGKASSLQGSETTYFPSDYMVGWRDGDHMALRKAPSYAEENLPDPEAILSAGLARPGDPFTLLSVDRHRQWRLVVQDVGTHYSPIVVGEDMSSVDNAVTRLIFINLLVGLAVLVTLASAGVWLVQMSLRPLVAMERTAAAIAGGDLARRVPELDERTELGQLSAALNTMLAQIESAFRAREASEERALISEQRMRQFVADASHELRTPLTTIRGFAELYRQGAAPDAGEVLRRIEDEAARMGLLVEDLLLLARLDRERPLQHAPVALTEVVSNAAAAAHAVAPDRDVGLEIAPGGHGLTVLGDEERLRQVVDNLLTNALIHTPAGSPVLLRVRPDGAEHAVIEVSDRGPGLTPDHAARVFERFYRVDKARSRKAAAPAVPPPDRANAHSGAGLGLAIVAALVAAHAGTVEVDSVPGDGATFRVRLPVVPPA